MKKYTIQDIDKMDGHEFEYFCAELLKNTGYEKVKVTPGSGDQGIDVIAYKDGIKFGIQCKCYASDIGNKAVQEAFSGKEFYKCHIGVVFSNRYFTSSAMELAARNRILLWDRSYLIDLLKNSDLFYEDNTQEDIPFSISADEIQSTETVTNSNLNDNEKTEEVQLIETVMNADSVDEQRIVETPSTDTVINIESNENEDVGTDNAEQNEKYDIYISVYNKHIIKNSIMRENRAREISRLTGISATIVSGSLLSYPSKLMSNLSKEEAESIVDRLKPVTGCTAYMKEAKEPGRESTFSRIKDSCVGVLVIILGIISPVMTKVCWDWEQKIGDGFGVCTLMFAILTFLTTVPLILCILCLLLENKPIDDGK